MEIWKFPFPVKDHFTVEMPCGATILTVQMQGERPCMWALVETSAPMRERSFRIVGTGHTLDSETRSGKYVGTVQQADGRRVWHLFEVKL